MTFAAVPVSLLFALLTSGGLQTANPEVTLCGQQVPPPVSVPPADSGPVVYLMALCFSAQGNVSSIVPETYLTYVDLRPSRPSLAQWVPYEDETIDVLRSDLQRLWATGFLDDVTIEAADYHFSNGVLGKVITYHLEERERIKIVRYEGMSRLSQTKIDEALRDRQIEIRLDSFLDRGTVTRVKKILRDLMAEQGYAYADVTHSITAVAGRPKLVDLTFNITEGPRLAIRDVEFLGNRAVADAALEGTMKSNRAEGLGSFLSRGGTFNDATFAEDAQRVEDYYRDHGYISARVGRPELRALDDAPDGSTRWIQLRVPITEGMRYRVGTVAFEGNTLVKAEALRPLFKLREGEWYSQQSVQKGLEKARELYGAGGYMEFTGYPDLQPRAGPSTVSGSDPPTVDVTIRMSEGPQYFVHRITFTGNTTTHDNVIRRELRLYEGGVFNAEALKQSVRRLNQLGYFKPLDDLGKTLQVDKTPGRTDSVDITLKLEEQNRNQIQFGAGVSQYEGFFGNVSYTTSNFLGRGESLTLAGQKGARSTSYQIAFTEPYVFNRPITAGIDLYSRKIDYLTNLNVVGYSEVRSGVGVTGGRPLFQFTRLFLTYGYEVVDTAVSDDLLDDVDDEEAVGVPLFNPFLDEGRHIESRLTPSVVYNTVDGPFAPRHGRRITLNATIAGGFLGGTTDYTKSEIDVVQYIPLTGRTALGLRANAGWLRAYGDTRVLPYYLRYYLGGEYQIRGVDIRTVGPMDAQNRALGGDRFVLFNAEYYIDLFGPVRALAFHDAGQAFSEVEPIDLRQLRTSSGVELRVMVPMLNVPFRLIYAWNIYRDSFQPAQAFKFAVGTTF